MTDRREQVVTALRAAADAIEAEGQHKGYGFYVGADDDVNFAWPSAEQAARNAAWKLTLDREQIVEWGVWVAVERTESHLRNVWPTESTATEGIVDDLKE